MRRGGVGRTTRPHQIPRQLTGQCRIGRSLAWFGCPGWSLSRYLMMPDDRHLPQSARAAIVPDVLLVSRVSRHRENQPRVATG
jgi:hypothetical protein